MRNNNIQEEQWRDVTIMGIMYGRYMVSDQGNVLDLKLGRNLTFRYDPKTGFGKVQLQTLNNTRRSFLIHLLVLEVFRPVEFKEARKAGKLAVHKNGDIRYNMLWNLDFGTVEESQTQRVGKFSQIKH